MNDCIEDVPMRGSSCTGPCELGLSKHRTICCAHRKAHRALSGSSPDNVSCVRERMVLRVNPELVEGGIEGAMSDMGNCGHLEVSTGLILLHTHWEYSS